MNSRTRRWMIGAALLVFAGGLGGFAFLRTGRPFIYTDGQALIPAGELAWATHLVWDRPEPEAELPGPIEGRVQPLPDGRYLYGRVLGDGTTDLVIFDPRHREVGAVAIPGLNSPGHDLSPALGPDGTIAFASDREGGAGGFDLWTARLDGLHASDVRRLADDVNTAQDETDPAFDPAGAWVFVRRDPGVDGGKNGRLFAGGGAVPTHPLFDEGTSRLPFIDRDPWCAADGVGLWFVRAEPGRVQHLMHTWRHAGVFAAPVVVPELDLDGALRGPVTSARGFGLTLLKPGDGALVYQAHAHEVYPSHEGQRELEKRALLVMGGALGVLALLVLGRRFRQLDFITWCFILSLAVHLAVLYFLRDVPITTSMKAPAVPVGGFEVNLVSAGEGGGGRGGDGAYNPGGRGGESVFGDLHFGGHDDVPAVGGPGSDVAVVDRTSGTRTAPDLPAPAGPAFNEAVVSAASDRGTGTATSGVALRDEGTIVAAHAGHDAPAGPIGPQSLGSPAAAGSGGDRPVATRTLAAIDDAVQVVVPGSALAGDGSDDGNGGSGRGSGGGGRIGAANVPGLGDGPAPTPRGVEAPGVVVADAPRGGGGSPGGGMKNGVDAGPTVLAPLAAAGSGSGPGSGGSGSGRVLIAATRQGSAGGGGDSDLGASVALPGSAIGESNGGGRGERVATGLDLPALGGGLPLARQVGQPGGTALRDAPVGPVRGGGSGEVTAGTKGTSSEGRGGGALRPLDLPGFGTPRAAGVDASRGARPGSGDGSGVGPPSPGQGDSLFAGVGAPGSMIEGAARVAGASLAPVGLQTSVFQNRFGPGKVQALEKFGGTRETEAAVAKGLAYLAKIQNQDGSWGDPRHVEEKYGHVCVGKTALALLAFLGAGHTPDGSGPYAAQLSRAMKFLLEVQDQDSGHFGDTSAYSHGISTYALAECFGLTHDEKLKAPVQRAIDWICTQQNRTKDKRNRGGWGYFSATRTPEDSFARTSVSVWQVMALESARLSGFHVRDDVLGLAKAFFIQEYDAAHGYFLYNREPTRLQSNWRTLPASTPAAVFALLLTGTSAQDERLQHGLQYTLDRRPTAYRRFDSEAFVRDGAGNVYFWYYGSLACFLAGGDTWQQWNTALKDVLPRAQAADGSFEPIDEYARIAGDTRQNRAYTTAMCVLSLEVYYRYFTPLLTGR